MSFLCRGSLRDKVRHSFTLEELGVEHLHGQDQLRSLVLPQKSRIKWGEKEKSGHLCFDCHDKLVPDKQKKMDV